MSQEQLSKFKPSSHPNYILEIRQALKAPEAVEKDSLDPITAAEVDDKKKDTQLKGLYAKWFIGILLGQLVLMNIIFIFSGLDLLEYREPAYLKLYMGGTLSEVFGVVFVITRYLFSKK